MTITATASAGGISQSKTMTATITTYVNVGIDSTPTNHEGTGTTVWLVEGNHDLTYTPVIVPEGAELTATGLVRHDLIWRRPDSTLLCSDTGN